MGRRPSQARRSWSPPLQAITKNGPLPDLAGDRVIGLGPLRATLVLLGIQALPKSGESIVPELSRGRLYNPRCGSD